MDAVVDDGREDFPRAAGGENPPGQGRGGHDRQRSDEEARAKGPEERIEQHGEDERGDGASAEYADERSDELAHRRFLENRLRSARARLAHLLVPVVFPAGVDEAQLSTQFHPRNGITRAPDFGCIAARSPS